MNTASPFVVYECFMNTRPPDAPPAAVSDESARASTKVDAQGSGALVSVQHSALDRLSAPRETTVETAPEAVSSLKDARSRAISRSPTPRLRLTPFRRRLPRFVRAKRSHRPPIALQERDIELIRTAYEYRLISTPQYLELFSDESRDGVYRRLQRLFHHGYLDRVGSNPNAPLVYAVGRRGADVLDVAPAKDVGDRYVAHRLMISSFRIALTLAARERGIDLTWQNTIGDAPVRPDAFFRLRFPELPDGRNRASFCLEADRSTMTTERFVEKIEAYCRWYDAGSHTALLGIRRFRVLTVTKSEERMESLIAAVGRMGTANAVFRMFWFTSEGRLGGLGLASLLEAAGTSADEPYIAKSLGPGRRQAME